MSEIVLLFVQSICRLWFEGPKDVSGEKGEALRVAIRKSDGEGLRASGGKEWKG